MTPDNKRLIEYARTVGRKLSSHTVRRKDGPAGPAARIVYEGADLIQSLADALEQADKPAGRQSASSTPSWNPFWPTYRALTDNEKALHDAVKDKATELLNLVQTIKPGRYRLLSITALEESIMWAVKELTA